MDIKALAERYDKDGYISGVPLLSTDEALSHRKALEEAEAQIGPLHYVSKVHTIHTSPWQLATLPSVLDIVQALIGPDILLYNVTYIIKEPHSTSHVSWHQDLTYWGLSHDDQVSMWLALSEADETSGCMQMIPGSHTKGVFQHHATDDDSNVLLQGQTVNDVDEAQAVLAPLRPGEASFHHGWTLHNSMPNRSDDRRIGLNVQYVAAHVRQTKHDADTAILVRGEDKYKHYEYDLPAASDLDPDALARQKALHERHREIAGTQ